MARRDNPVYNMLNLALANSLNHMQFYLDAANAVETPKIKALLMVLAEAEEELAEKIEDMMITGIVDEVSEAAGIHLEEPDETPFDLAREDSDPRIFICNKALRQEANGFSFYRSIAIRAKSDVVRSLFTYFAHFKTEQIRKIRRICDTF
ncbi:MAG: hypothetical protein BAJATHORv1_20127 [Candidatus Thorarchaeota archaeon]|nr:MAG: hypothetical protein BAJATHORv1_20127 [Candidatus Thorarchaeota archaeon]